MSNDKRKPGSVLVIEDSKLFQAAAEAAAQLGIPLIVGPGCRLMDFLGDCIACKECGARAPLASAGRGELRVYHEDGCHVGALLGRVSEIAAGVRVSRRERRRLRGEYDRLLYSFERAEKAGDN